MPQTLSTYQISYRAPLLPSVLLVLTLLQGSSFSLSLAFRGPLANDVLISLVTLVWLAMYAFSLMALIVSYGVNWISWLVRYRLLLTCLLAGTAFSAAWSVDTSLTLERSIHLIGTSIVAIYLGFSLPLNHILRISAMVLGFIMLSSVGAALLVPGLGIEEYQGQSVWAGTLASKNTLGFWAAVSVLLSASLACWAISTERRLMYSFIAALSLLCLYQSVSATSLLALISASLIMIYLHICFNLRLSMVAVVLLGLLVGSVIGFALYFIDTAELIGRSGDMTGRGEVWAQTWQLILNRPLTGYGYGTLWFPTDDSIRIQQSLTDFSWTVFHAHNGLLQVASEIGLPLTLLALLMIFQQVIEVGYCQYKRQQPGVLFILGFLVALLLSNYSEARLLTNRELYWIFFIMLPVSMLQQVSLSSTQTDKFPSPAPRETTDTTTRLRKTRARKAHHQQLKERIKNLSGIKVLNSADTMAEQPSDSDTRRHIIVDSKRSVSGKAARLAQIKRTYKKSG